MPLDLNGASGAPVGPALPGDPLTVQVKLTQGDVTVVLDDMTAVGMLAGVIGLDDAEVALDMSATPGVWGGWVNGITVAARKIFLPVVVDARAAGGSGWQAARDLLGQVVDPFVGPTTITVVCGDRARSIEAWPVTEPRSWDLESWGASGWQILGLDFVAPRPMWRQLGGLDISWDAGGHTTVFLDGLPAGAGLLPSLTRSTQIGDPSQVVVGGDVDTPGTWLISGTRHIVTAAHENGRSWSIDLTGTTQDVTISTDPLASFARGADGTNYWSRWVRPPDLWPLQRGAQTVTVTVTASDATTSVRLTGDTLWRRAL